MSEKNQKYTIHVVSHTHWDREWRYPFQIYRGMLIEMIDNLLKVLKPNKEYKYFLFDSQCIALEDYLEIKPEKEEELREFVRDGRIHIGPWYTLPDTPELSGESLVRNLLKGIRITEEWEGKKWSGYSPFSFGQSSQMPQIYNGFELDHIFFYRGNNNHITKNEFIWESPDGSKILGMRSINPYGRANWYVHVFRPVALNKWPFEWEYHWNEGQLPFHPCNEEESFLDYWLLEGEHCQKLYMENLEKALKEIKDFAVKDATSPHLLYLDGMDQSNPYPRTPEIIKLANELNTGDTYIHSSFYDYVQAVKKDTEGLSILKGEFRYTMVDGLWQNLFPGMLSARMYLKQQNRQCELLLQRTADTWTSLAEQIGMEYPQGLLDKAWKYLLANHSHDSIAGCGIDQVHEDVEYRNRQVSLIAGDLTNKSIAYIIRNINGNGLNKDAICLIAFNSTQYMQTEVLSSVIDLPEDESEYRFTVEDESGNVLPVFFLQDYNYNPIVNHPLEFPIPFKVRRYHCLIQVRNVPPMGYKTFIVKPGNKQLRNKDILPVDARLMENEYLKVNIQPDGRLDLYCKRTKKQYYGLHYFEDRSDVGDHATQKAAVYDEIINTIGTHAEISLVADNDLITTYQICISLKVPKEALSDGSHRSQGKAPFVIETNITLKAGTPYLQISTSINNNISDHKVRVLFPSGYKGVEQSYSETHFGITYRDIHLPDTATWKEPMLPYYPQYRFCGVEDEISGLALFNMGLPEYAVHEDKERTIGLTLLRTFRFPVIGANPEDVEYDMSQVMTQCKRPFTFDYALYPYAGNCREGGVFEWADRFHNPLRIHQTGKSNGILPTVFSFFEIDPDVLVFSAVKLSSRNNNLIIRLFNPTKKKIDGSITFFRKIKEAYWVKLNEKRDKKAVWEGKKVSVIAEGHKILSLEVKLQEE